MSEYYRSIIHTIPTVYPKIYWFTMSMPEYHYRPKFPRYIPVYSFTMSMSEYHYRSIIHTIPTVYPKIYWFTARIYDVYARIPLQANPNSHGISRYIPVYSFTMSMSEYHYRSIIHTIPTVYPFKIYWFTMSMSEYHYRPIIPTVYPNILIYDVYVRIPLQVNNHLRCLCQNTITGQKFPRYIPVYSFTMSMSEYHYRSIIHTIPTVYPKIYYLRCLCQNTITGQ